VNYGRPAPSGPAAPLILPPASGELRYVSAETPTPALIYAAVPGHPLGQRVMGP